MLFNKLGKSKLAVVGLLFFTIVGCTSDSSESLYPTNDSAAKLLYDTSLKTVIDSKCISCHVYHLEGTNKYDSYEKTKSSLSQMLARINTNENTAMPPAGSPQLTEEEKQLFQQFRDILDSKRAQEIPDSVASRITVNWTAYKYPDFSARAPVSGAFDEITYNLNENFENPEDLLKDAIVTINTKSVNLGSDQRNQNVGAFFSFFTSEIKGKVDEYTATSAQITFTMNGIEQQHEFVLALEEGKIVLTGAIPDMNFFNWQNGYDRLNAVCGELHQQKVWEDIEVVIEILLEE